MFPRLFPYLKNSARLTLIALFLVSFINCGSLISCLIDSRMQLETEVLPQGIVFKNFEAEIKASIKNSWGDDNFDYHFEIDNGRLPEGLYTERNGQSFFIRGIPEEIGSFIIRVNVFSLDLLAQASNNFVDNCIIFDDFREFEILIIPDS